MISQDSVSEKKRILVVEDEGIIARGVAAMLVQLGYEVVGQAGTYEEAMEMASTLPVDLVLMDIKIRGATDGVQTAEAVRERLGLPVIFVTAHADDETLRRANITQPFGYIIKPFSQSVLKVAIEVGLNRHRLQEQSDSKQTWLRPVLEGISEAVLAADADGQIILMNPGAEQLTGWARDEAVGRPLGEVLQLLDDGTELDLLRLERNSANGETLCFPNASVRHKSGSQCTVICSFGLVQKQGETVKHGYVALVRPAIGAVIASPLPSSDRQLEELSYALSNDLREPLRNVSCFARLLERNAALNLDDCSREYLNFIVEGSMRIESQMSALRRFHLAGTVQYKSGVCADATEICHEILDALAADVEEAEAEVSLDPLPTVAIDPAALKEVFQHLIANALQFRAQRRLHLHIGAVRIASSWQFCFSDNGLGFDGQQAERIFSLFTRAHLKPPSGNGLGLAICRRAIEAAGGRIWADSEEGVGADFFVTLPALGLQEQPNYGSVRV